MQPPDGEDNRKPDAKAADVLLLDASPFQPQCCLETALGTLVLTGHCMTADSATRHCQQLPFSIIAPRVSSLSVLCTRPNGSFHSLRLFAAATMRDSTTNHASSSSSSNTDNHGDQETLTNPEKTGRTAFHDLEQTVRSIRGLQRRLEQMVQSKVAELERRRLSVIVGAAQTTARTKHGHPLQTFQSQSTMIFREVVVAVQYRRRQQQELQQSIGGKIILSDREKQGVGGDHKYIKALYQALEDMESRSPTRNVVKELSEDLERVALNYEDSGKRHHPLWATLSSGHDHNHVLVLKCEASLPQVVLEDFPVPISNLSNGEDATQPAAKRLKTLSPESDNTGATNKNPSPLEELFQSAGLTCGLPEGHERPQPGLVTCFQEFINRVDRLQDFWNEMEHLDRHCSLLEPESSPTIRRSVTHRKIQVNDTVHLILTVDVYRPRDPPPSYRFSSSPTDGNTEDATDFNARFQNNLKAGLWDTKLTMRDNLERCLGICLSSPAGMVDNRAESEGGVRVDSKLDDDGLGEGNECGICYTRDLPADEDDDDDGGQPPEIPSICCENKSCRRDYHRSCLYEWLESLSTSRVTFDIVIGQCPYCQDPISAPLPGA